MFYVYFMCLCVYFISIKIIKIMIIIIIEYTLFVSLWGFTFFFFNLKKATTFFVIQVLHANVSGDNAHLWDS